MTDYEALKQAVIAGQAEKVKELVQDCIEGGMDANTIISDGMISAMSVVGERMNSSVMFIPEVLASAKAMKGGMEILKPMIVGESTEDVFAGKVVIGTVKGDVHNIGKNLVSLMMESTGFQVIDLGEDVRVDKFIEVVGAEKPDILGLSALLTITMDEMRVIIDKLKEKNLRDSVKVMIGGAPVTQEYADAIGADGYAPDAGMAAAKAKVLMG